MARKNLTQPGETTIAGIDGNDNINYARINSGNRGLLTIPPILCKIFAGKEFFYSEAFELAETTDTQDYIFVTPNTTEWAHFAFHATGSAITEVALWEDTKYSSTDELTTYNNNRNSATPPSSKLYQVTATSTTDTGTRLIHVKSGSATRQSKDSMSAGYADELFLKQNAKYRISFATASTSNLCNLLIQWHEHTNGS